MERGSQALWFLATCLAKFFNLSAFRHFALRFWNQIWKIQACHVWRNTQNVKSPKKLNSRSELGWRWGCTRCNFDSTLYSYKISFHFFRKIDKFILTKFTKLSSRNFVTFYKHPNLIRFCFIKHPTYVFFQDLQGCRRLVLRLFRNLSHFTYEKPYRILCKPLAEWLRTKPLQEKYTFLLTIISIGKVTIFPLFFNQPVFLLLEAWFALIACLSFQYPDNEWSQRLFPAHGFEPDQK